MNASIDFDRNYNSKLDCFLFTSIRSYSKDRLSQLKNRVGSVFDVYVEGLFYCNAKLVDLLAVELKNIPLYLLMLDTGLTVEKEIFILFESFGIKPNDMVLILIFESDE